MPVRPNALLMFASLAAEIRHVLAEDDRPCRLELRDNRGVTGRSARVRGRHPALVTRPLILVFALITIGTPHSGPRLKRLPSRRRPARQPSPARPRHRHAAPHGRRDRTSRSGRVPSRHRRGVLSRRVHGVQTRNRHLEEIAIDCVPARSRGNCEHACGARSATGRRGSNDMNARRGGSHEFTRRERSLIARTASRGRPRVTPAMKPERRAESRSILPGLSLRSGGIGMSSMYSIVVRPSATRMWEATRMVDPSPMTAANCVGRRTARTPPSVANDARASAEPEATLFAWRKHVVKNLSGNAEDPHRRRTAGPPGVMIDSIVLGAMVPCACTPGRRPNQTRASPPHANHSTHSGVWGKEVE